MPEPRAKTPPMHLDVTGLTPLRPQLDDWERALIEPVLVRLFESPTRAYARQHRIRRHPGSPTTVRPELSISWCQRTAPSWPPPRAPQSRGCGAVRSSGRSS